LRLWSGCVPRTRPSRRTPPASARRSGASLLGYSLSPLSLSVCVSLCLSFSVALYVSSCHSCCFVCLWLTRSVCVCQVGTSSCISLPDKEGWQVVPLADLASPCVHRSMRGTCVPPPSGQIRCTVTVKGAQRDHLPLWLSRTDARTTAVIYTMVVTLASAMY